MEFYINSLKGKLGYKYGLDDADLKIYVLRWPWSLIYELVEFIPCFVPVPQFMSWWNLSLAL